MLQCTFFQKKYGNSNISILQIVNNYNVSYKDIYTYSNKVS
jgi:hypothetical protein